MSITVKNSTEDAPIVTLFGQLDDGSYTAKRMNEDEVPYAKCWENAIDQVMVYIAPDDAQLRQIVQALNDDKLAFGSLQQYGSTKGGTSVLPI